MLKIQHKTQFHDDFQLQLAAGKDPAPFTELVELLEKQLPLPSKYCDNPLVGTRGRWCCRVSFDWWLIYRCDVPAGTITFEQTGSPEYLFE